MREPAEIACDELDRGRREDDPMSRHDGRKETLALDDPRTVLVPGGDKVRVDPRDALAEAPLELGTAEQGSGYEGNEDMEPSGGVDKGP